MLNRRDLVFFHVQRRCHVLLFYMIVVTVMLIPPSLSYSTRISRIAGRSRTTRRNLSSPSSSSSSSSHPSPASKQFSSSKQQALLQERQDEEENVNIWEIMSSVFYDKEDALQVKDFVQTVTIFRVGIPSLFVAASAGVSYPYVAIWLANLINDSGVFAVVAQDSSQYIQNILTTSGLVFSLLVGQTYYFMYQQQEAIYLALFEEVTVAKSLLEQIALVCQGRDALYQRILLCIDAYVRNDLMRFNDIEPALLISRRPVDDPLEDILYLTSVGEPSVVYQTVKSLREARAYRLGALQKKLPTLHMNLLWTLALIVMFTFPLLGAGVQTIGGMGILQVQSWYLSFIVFGICLVMGIIYELQKPAESGAYNARIVLDVMVKGLEEELHLRLLQGKKQQLQQEGVVVEEEPRFPPASSSTTTTTTPTNVSFSPPSKRNGLFRRFRRNER